MSNNLKSHILKSGYRQNFVAEQISVTPTELSHYVCGRRKPSDETKLKLSILLRASLKEIFPNG